MTFNDDINIDASNTSTSSGGGRGGGPKLAIGGGIGGIVVVVIALLLGANPADLLGGSSDTSTAPGVDVSQCRTGADANRDVNCRVIATANSLDAVWATKVRGYRKPQVRLFSSSVSTACGAATSDVGPFYCPADSVAYFDTSFFQVLVDRFGSSGGPLAQEYVVAHEFGHHIQNLLGDISKAQQGAQGATGGSVRTELQADCYAGIWAHDAASTPAPGSSTPYLKPLTNTDIADALSAASSVGDDRIQKSSGGRVNPEAWTHGSSAQRQKWFTAGYSSGSLQSCDTYNAKDLG